MAKAEKKKAEVKAGMYDVIVAPLVTEKSQAGVEHNKVTFKVAPWATKPQIKAAVENIFSVKVEKVNVLTLKGKTKRFRGNPGQRSDVKKAVITLAEGENIEIATA